MSLENVQFPIEANRVRFLLWFIDTSVFFTFANNGFRVAVENDRKFYILQTFDQF